MIATNIWFWVGFIAFVLAMLAARPRRLPPNAARRRARRKRRSGPPSGSRSRCVFAAGLLVFYGHHVGADVPHRLRDRGVAQRRQHLRHRPDLRVLRACRRVPAPRAVLGHPRRAGHARPVHRRSARLLLARFDWILYIFGAMLVVTGIRMAFKQRRGVRRRAESGREARATLPPDHRTTTTASTSSPSRTAGGSPRRCCSCWCSSRSRT